MQESGLNKRNAASADCPRKENITYSRSTQKQQRHEIAGKNWQWRSNYIRAHDGPCTENSNLDSNPKEKKRNARPKTKFFLTGRNKTFKPSSEGACLVPVIASTRLAAVGRLVGGAIAGARTLRPLLAVLLLHGTRGCAVLPRLSHWALHPMQAVSLLRGR